MEIERAIRGSSDARLRAKYAAAVHVVRRAFALYPYARAPLTLLYICRFRSGLTVIDVN
jgi:hypothetical protein